MPVSVQHLQDELVQDVLTTAGTLRDLCGAQEQEHRVTHGLGQKTLISMEIILNKLSFMLKGQIRTII